MSERVENHYGDNIHHHYPAPAEKQTEPVKEQKEVKAESPQSQFARGFTGGVLTGWVTALLVAVIVVGTGVPQMLEPQRPIEPQPNAPREHRPNQPIEHRPNPPIKTEPQGKIGEAYYHKREEKPVAAGGAVVPSATGGAVPPVAAGGAVAPKTK